MNYFEKFTIEELAREIYLFAIECAEQVTETRNDHGDHDPRYDYTHYTNDWTCNNVKLDIAGWTLQINAEFNCPTKSSCMENPTCTYMAVECKSDEYDTYDECVDAIEEQLRKLVGESCYLSVE